MDGMGFFMTAVLGVVALAAAGVLLSIGMGKIEMEKTERTWLAVLSGFVLLAILGFAALT
jgi:hypothetical protein